MRVKVKNWRGERVTDLEDALTPSVGAYEAEGELERAKCLANKAAEGLGRLAALLVERRLISLEEAATACGITDDLELATDA